MNVLKLIELGIKLVSIGGTLIIILRDKRKPKERYYNGRNGE